MRRIVSATATTSDVRTSGGITLLEVLISCGLLIVGLSTIAALLPAAGSRLKQATTEDRAAALLSNAMAEIFNRSLLAADIFTPGEAGAVGRTLAIGKILGRLPTYGALPSGRTAADYFSGPSTAGRDRFGSDRTFVLEDVLVYDPPRFTTSPRNAFSRDAAGLGPRKFREGICWGAMLTPDELPAVAGGRAVLSVVVFKRDSQDDEGQFEDGMPLVLTRVGSFYESDLAPTDSLLSGCSSVLAIPADPSKTPRWFRIMSSWPWETPTGRKTRVILRNQSDFEALTGSATPGTNATVFAFEGVVRVDELVVALN
jgi:type II secretory pathway pseudopilin PulG